MKILHTSDWHIGQHFYRFDRDDEHRAFFDSLCSIVAQECPDAMVVSGDVFHNPAPSAVSKQLFVEGVLKVHAAAPQMTIVITAGNHDSGSRLEAERQLWSMAGIHVIGGAKREGDGTFDVDQFIIDIAGKGFIIAVPYFHPANYPLAAPGIMRDSRQSAFYGKLLASVADCGRPIVMMAHLAVQGCNTRGHDDEPVGGMLKDDLSQLGTGYDYLALGHIHMPQKISDRAYYCGSAIPVSFSEDYGHGVNIVEIANHGDVPLVKTVEIAPRRGVKTVPACGACMQDALDALQNLRDDDDSYIRLLVDQEDPLPADAENRANLIVKDKACRFCEVVKKPRAKAASATGQIEVQSVADLKSYSPLDIASRSYERIVGAPMSEELKTLMRQAIDEIEN